MLINKKEDGTLSDFSFTLCCDIDTKKNVKAMRHNKIIIFCYGAFFIIYNLLFFNLGGKKYVKRKCIRERILL